MPLVDLPSDAKLDAPKLSGMPEGVSLDQQGPTKPTTIPGKLAYGFKAPIVGMNLLASQAEQYLPGIVPEATAKKDLAEAEREKKQYEAGSSGSWWETLGNVANPLNYVGAAGVKGAGLAAGAARGLQSGLVSSLVQPEHSPGQVAAGTALGGVLGAATEPLAKAIAGADIGEVNNFIKKAYDTAVKTSVSGKQTLSRADQHVKDMWSAINSIIDNKAGLRFTDNAGQVKTGELPTSLDEFAQAIDQTKQKIFSEYDARAKAAGQAFGGRNNVSLMPVVHELEQVANNPVVRDLNPGAAMLAQTQADTLRARGNYTVEEAQSAIQHLNSLLHGYYTSAPTREVNGASGVDSLIASKLREGLDAAVDRASGPGYQDLKNQYGSLRKLEKEVVHRAIVAGRQEPGHGMLGRIGDVVGAHDVIHGIASFHPTKVATGLAVRAWVEGVAHLRNPNRAVHRIFQAAEGLRAPLDPARREIGGALRRTVPAAGVTTYQNATGQMNATPY